MAYAIYSPGKWEVYEQIAVALIPEKRKSVYIYDYV